MRKRWEDERVDAWFFMGLLSAALVIVTLIGMALTVIIGR